MTNDRRDKPLSNPVYATYLRPLSTTSSLVCFTRWSLLSSELNAFTVKKTKRKTIRLWQ